jgi:DNA primase
VFVGVKMLNKIINRFGNNYKSKNKELWYRCPFHKGQSFTSFSVNKTTGFYKCFKCCESGVVGDDSINKQPQPIILPKEEEINKLIIPNPSELAKDRFCKYLQTRGINKETIDNYNFDCCFSAKGVGVINNKKSGVYGYWLDVTNRITLGKDGAKAKRWIAGSRADYVIIKHKEETIVDRVFVFEGLEDLFSFIQLNPDINFRGSVLISIFGVTNLQKTLRDIGNNKVDVCLCLDNDKAATDSINKRPPIKGTYYSYVNILQEHQVKDWNELLIKQQSN